MFVACMAIAVFAWALPAGAASSVSVTAGKPSEYKFALSPSSVKAGKVTFKVTNKGLLAHDFKVCAKAVTSTKLNTCTGTGTKKLATGQSATVSITFKTKGKYEYLCTVPGHASSGMKGLLGIGVKVSAAAASTSSGGGGGVTGGGQTGGGVAAETLMGDPAAGASVFSGADPPCRSCHTMRAAGATGGVGPNLDNAKPGQQTVISFVTNGTGVMPAYGTQLSQPQINNLAAYVYRSTH
jgi:mono/diheme cytochrome c family protein